MRNYDMEVLCNQVMVVLRRMYFFPNNTGNLRWGNKEVQRKSVKGPVSLPAQMNLSSRECQMDITLYIEQGGTNVSGGQKQRLWVLPSTLKAQDPDP